VLSVPHRASTDKRRQILEAWYRAEMKAALEPLISKWEKRLDVRVERAFIQKMKTKWGGSNPRLRHIRLNLELAKKPPQCLDYVVLHEMLHFLVPNHSERFVTLMDHHLPQWRTVRQMLNEAPLSYTEWSH
jgi:predicted metal-dependent hydrolase